MFFFMLEFIYVKWNVICCIKFLTEINNLLPSDSNLFLFDSLGGYYIFFICLFYNVWLETLI